MQNQHNSPASRSPEPLPSEWTDYVFAKLQLAYGRDFMAQWPGIEPAAVKADWADKLAGLQNRTHAIDHALEHLPSDKPVNALRFRELCRMAPDEVYKALPKPPVNQTLAQQVVQAAKASTNGAAIDHLTPIRGLMHKEFAGDKRLTRFQKDFWRIALKAEIQAKYGIDTSVPFSLVDLAAAVHGRRAA